MKKMIIFTLIFALLMGLTACGSSNETASVPSAEESAVQESAPQEAGSAPEAPADDSQMAPESSTMEVIYYLDLGDGSIMVAPATEEGKAMMGDDYFIVLLEWAKILGADGQEVSMGDLTRGSTLEIQWPGMVMESYPAQISAEIVTVVSEDVPADFPAEDQIPSLGGPQWWAPQAVTELPGLVLEYTTPDFVVSMVVAGQENASEGFDPLEMTYDDNNTIKRSGFDAMTLVLEPTADSIQVEAFASGSAEGEEVSVAEDGSISLVDGDEVIYVVTASWDSEVYSGSGNYAFKVIVPAE